MPHDASPRDETPFGDSGPVPGVRVVRLLAPLVPSVRRAEWLAEWEGELHHAWHSRARRPDPLLRSRLTIRSIGAIADALWLRRHHGATDMLGTDLRYALRTMRRRPGFATIVVLTLGLGIGATTAIFSIVNGVLLRPLPFPEPERLYAVRGQPTDGNPEKVGRSQSYPDFVEFRAATSSLFTGMTAMRTHPATLIDGGGEPARVQSTFITGEGWAVLRARAHIGRTLVPSDDAPGSPPVAVISHALWQSRYGGDPGIVGRTVTINAEPVTFVGVVPPDFRLVPGDVWRPLIPDPLDVERGVHRLFVLGRLAPGVQPEEAEAALQVVARRLELQYPQDNTNRGVELEALHEAIVGDTRPALLILLGAVSLVLLIGCANLASLFLARAAAREREIAVRSALGAGRGRLVRQFLTESLLLALIGGAAGLAVAWAGMRALIAWVPRTVPRASEIALDMPVLLFLLVISSVVGIAFGVLPGMQLRNSARANALKEGTRGSTTGVAARRLRQGLVVTEVALATVLVVGAALLMQSFWRLHSTAPGFSPDGLVVTQLQLPVASYDSTSKVIQFYERLQEEAAALPGVEAVSVAFEHPLSQGWTSSFTIADRDPPPRGQEPEARVRPVWPGYFKTVGVPIVRGRDIAATDRKGAPGVVLVNEAFVRRHFPDGEAIGKKLNRLAWWPGIPTSYEIVGVVADEPFMGRGQPGDPATYFPHAQFPMNDMYLIVRASGDPLALAPAIRERVWRVDANLPVERIIGMRALLGDSVAEPRFNAALLALFALAALLLAAIGIYGVLSYTVAQRTNEIGVRMALGAERWSVIRLVVGEGAMVAMLGIALGLAGAFALSRVMDSVLYGTSSRNPLLFTAVAGFLAAVALLAAYLPARRASRIEPVVALRYD